MEYVYAALLLHKVGSEVSEDNLKKVISATGKDVDESKVKVLVASLNGVDIDEKLANASVAAAPAASGDSGAAEAPVEEKKKEEPKAESAAGLASLFG
ncbi:50S ribosomal protein P1 [archaeon]|jgi:large subunit ribosomal protein L12|nr:50S ribosomal protein P1 [archaeon]MBT6182738.1 50S ribosomal protein P1 [archaeon]MBT6606150.1 50S ribosomal protein P1 [archaeon]MBT7252010.1 50S ribosomal protein P1 [archaeon]MBT7660924.1 50S ribosomal protein P1 [archaeon]